MTDEKLLRVWRRRRERGFWHFALLRGGLPAIACALAVSAILAMDAGPGGHLGFIVGIILFTVLAMISIPFKWRDYEARYRRLTEDSARSAFE